jgi:CO/xanthine dehydrogenase Mo-binding subunit
MWNVDDMQLPGMLHMACLRSPYPHATILSIQTSTAQAMPGVIAVVTGDDLSERLHIPVMPLVPGMQIPPHPLLARGAVHAAGAPVAAVVAYSRALAQDAANAIAVEYAALPVVVNAEKTLDPGAQGHRPYRYAVHGAKAVGSDSGGAGQKEGIKNKGQRAPQTVRGSSPHGSTQYPSIWRTRCEKTLSGVSRPSSARTSRTQQSC